MLNRFMINHCLIEIFKVRILNICYLRDVVAKKSILDTLFSQDSCALP